MTNQQPGTEPPRAPDEPLSSADVTAETTGQRRRISGPAKLGAAVLIVSGILWALAGAWVIAVTLPSLFAEGWRDMVSPQFVAGVGIVIVIIALFQILIGVFAWRGDPLARWTGVIYTVVFGLGELCVYVWLMGAPTGVEQPILAGFVIGYMYTIVVFMIFWHGAAESKGDARLSA